MARHKKATLREQLDHILRENQTLNRLYEAKCETVLERDKELTRLKNDFAVVESDKRWLKQLVQTLALPQQERARF